MDSAGHQRAFLVLGGCSYVVCVLPLALRDQMAFECHEVDRHLVLEAKPFYLSSQGQWQSAAALNASFS